MGIRIFNPLLFVTILLSSLIVTTAYAQTSRQVVISISEIEYDDPNFVALREILKKNTKVKLVKPSYASGTATISFTYPGDATQLWEELPKTSKQFFKLISIDDNSISLEYAKKNPEISSAPDKTKKEDCFACDYFPMCNYDVTKSYEGGKKFRGIRKDDNSVIYYYCEKGDVIMRWDYTKLVTRQEWVSGTWDDGIITYDDYVNKTASLTILRSNVPVGTTWTGMIGNKEHQFTMKAKGIKLIHEGKTYNDVVRVMEYSPGQIDYYYYARNVGYVGKNLVDEQMRQRRNVFKTSWTGTWKLTSDNGNPVSPDEITEYLQIGEDGAGLLYYVKKKSTGKFYKVYEGNVTGYDAIRDVEIQAGSTLFLKFKFASGKELDMNKNSVPKKTISIGSKIYEYLGESFDFNK